MEENLKENLSTDPWNEACLKELCQFFDLDSKEGGKDQLIERCVTFLMKPTATNMTTIEALDKSRKSKTVKIATKKKSSSSSKKRKVTEGYFGNLPTLQAPLQFFAQASFALLTPT